jgi:hypothetical protein
MSLAGEEMIYRDLAANCSRAPELAALAMRYATGKPVATVAAALRAANGNSERAVFDN